MFCIFWLGCAFWFHVAVVFVGFLFRYASLVFHLHNIDGGGDSDGGNRSILLNVLAPAFPCCWFILNLVDFNTAHIIMLFSFFSCSIYSIENSTLLCIAYGLWYVFGEFWLENVSFTTNWTENIGRCSCLKPEHFHSIPSILILENIRTTKNNNVRIFLVCIFASLFWSGFVLISFFFFLFPFSFRLFSLLLCHLSGFIS